ncbi:MAG: ABC transporter ATP-binding protein [Planctomycetales bacterium]|nr:ABC transporter ATP-binding protein [Planctomycetales bacterium]
MALIKVSQLVKHFPKRGGFLNRVIAKVHAVNDVSFEIHAGETLGIVGESGCGKSTLGRVIMRLLDPTSGSIEFDGQPLQELSHQQMMPFRRKMQMVFQDPNSSLNPRLTIGAMLAEGIRFHNRSGYILKDQPLDQYIDSLLSKVGLRADDKSKYPHEFSGGQRQRIGIARALSVKPDFLVADEPVSALDVSVQAQVLNLMQDLRDDLSLTILFISHDLKVVDHFCDRMLVMYLGHVVEEMPCKQVHQNALHPYTQALLGANPVNDPDERHELTVLDGEVPSPYDPPLGCPFVTRCPIKTTKCESENPPLVQINDQQKVACWEVSAEKPHA